LGGQKRGRRHPNGGDCKKEKMRFHERKVRTLDEPLENRFHKILRNKNRKVDYRLKKVVNLFASDETLSVANLNQTNRMRSILLALIVVAGVACSSQEAPATEAPAAVDTTAVVDTTVADTTAAN
jgi:hypothetical protein